MCDRQYTIVCSFDVRSPRINAFQIHEWLYETVRLTKDDVRVIQIDGSLRKGYVKFVNSERMMRVLQPIQGDLDFYHENGVISKVTVEIAVVRSRRVRVTTFPPEVTEAQIPNVMSTYGEIKKIHDEIWSHAYRFKVKTGVRLVDISLKKRIPSHIKVDGHRALIQYEGQPMTCYRCNQQGHQITECPRRKTPASHQSSQDENSWANKVKRGTEKAPTIDNNNSNDIPQSSNGEARQVIELRARSIDEDPHNKRSP